MAVPDGRVYNLEHDVATLQKSAAWSRAFLLDLAKVVARHTNVSVFQWRATRPKVSSAEWARWFVRFADGQIGDYWVRGDGAWSRKRRYVQGSDTPPPWSTPSEEFAQPMVAWAPFPSEWKGAPDA